MDTISLNEGWRFQRLPGMALSAIPAALPDAPSETVTLPHTWYGDEKPYQGLTVYEKTVGRKPAWESVCLSFDGADQSCRVYVNGHLAGEHRGGYSRFRFPVPDDAMQEDTLTIRVFVDNSVDEDVAPSFGDFTVFGGLYRRAQLLITGRTHFDRCYYGTDGLIVRTSLDARGRGVATMEPHTVCATGDAVIEYRLCDETGALIDSVSARPDETASFTVDAPVLWDGVDNAHFYHVSATLYCGGVPCDAVSVRTGFRRVALSADAGLCLNGRPYMLRGVAKHQDRAGVFCAVTDDDIREDFAIIREMGANAVRLSHYQHAQTAYDCCDEAGLLCWAEIPMLKMTESQALMENAEQQLTELILQNIHHPSIFCWGIQNEIAMFRDALFMHANCRRLHQLVKTLDPERFSAAANLYPLKPSSELNAITDMAGYNLYFGWYYGERTDYGAYLEQMHHARPALPFGVTEYGVDANLSLHAEEPQVKDYSEEYQALYHETAYPQIESRPWLWGSFVWNMFDFSSSRRNEGGSRFLNAKGLVTHDRRTRKDAFYYYKARWSDEPFVHLCAKRFAKRARDKIDVKCYTNQPMAMLAVNDGLPLEGRAENGAVVFRDVPLIMGENRIVVTAGGLSDRCVWERVAEPEESYRLSDAGEGTPVRNWFLSEDELTRQGFFSLNDTANDLLESPDARRVLERFIPELVRVMTEKSVIPLGLSLKSILSRDADESLDVKALNAELNRIANKEADDEVK